MERILFSDRLGIQAVPSFECLATCRTRKRTPIVNAKLNEKRCTRCESNVYCELLERHLQQTCGFDLVVERRLTPGLVQVTLQLPGAIPVLDTGLDAAFSCNSGLEASELADKCDVVGAQSKHGAIVISTITDVDDSVECGSAAVSVEKRVEFGALAHVGGAADVACVLRVGGEDAALQDECSVLVECSGVRDDFVKQCIELVVTQDRVDIKSVAVREQEECSLTGGFERGNTTFHTRMERQRSERRADVVLGDALFVQLD